LLLLKLQLAHVYEVRPRKDKRGFDLISDALPFGRLWYATPDNAVGYAMYSSCSHDAVICVYDEAGNLIETQEQAAVALLKRHITELERLLDQNENQA
jgi:hypothetical protein